MRALILVFGIVLALAGLLVVRLVFAARASEKPRPAPGLLNGKLSPTGARPNCVTSEGAHPRQPGQAIEPLRLTGTPEEARERLLRVLAAMPGVEITVKEPLYVAATCRSRLFGFVDDLELRLDPAAGVVHVRSASREGYSDMKTNRKRVEEIRSRIGS